MLMFLLIVSSTFTATKFVAPTDDTDECQATRNWISGKESGTYKKGCFSERDVRQQHRDLYC